MPLPQALEPALIALIPHAVRALRATWILRVHGLDHLRAPADPRHIFAIWHGRQLALTGAIHLGIDRAPIVALVSASRDGRIQAPVLHALGLQTRTGSSSKLGTSGLRNMARAIDQGASGLLAVDGPAGPPFCAKSGAAALARMTGVPITPVGVTLRGGPLLTLPNTWDAFWLPAPGASLDATIGPPIPPPGPGAEALASTLDTLQRELARLNRTTPFSLRAQP